MNDDDIDLASLLLEIERAEQDALPYGLSCA